MNSTVVYNTHGRVIGRIQGEYLAKSVRNQHMLRKPPAWAWDRRVLMQARDAGVKWVVVKNMDEGKEYIAPLSDFFDRGLVVDRGYGLQIALPIGLWKEYDPAQPNLL